MSKLSLKHFSVSFFECINAKKEGRSLSRQEMFSLARAVSQDAWPDYQIAALLMAFRLKGLDSKETLYLTQAMAHYSEQLNGGPKNSFTVDKHSTGGVGDGVSLVLAPLAASLGLSVPMMSGRSLGLTGGTLDKLDAIPGFKSRIPKAQIERQVKLLGLALFGQTEKMAPVDRKLYALRDAVAAVDAIPLVISSIISKKLTEGLDGLVFDVKFGRGAIFETRHQARALAQGLVSTARACSLKSQAVITRMDEPLGRAIGNAPEVLQAWSILKPTSQQRRHWTSCGDFMEVALELAYRMLKMAGLVKTRPESNGLACEALSSGKAWDVFVDVLRAQGVRPHVARELDRHLPSPKRTVVVRAPSGGVVRFVDARHVALATRHLRVLRRRQEDQVDLSGGLWLAKKTGDEVAKGEELARLVGSLATPQEFFWATQEVGKAFDIGRGRVRPKPLIVEVM
ncbi:MAG: thymidine phosphorylase [Elusimicrobia bacterium]|nr:thymidine phosphorylase [Elusimicrobiota bacterium]